MPHSLRRHPGLVSAMLYVPLALLAAGLFFTATLLAGGSGWVARLGGSGWVFLLALIILMPTVTPLVKRRLQADPTKEPSKNNRTLATSP